MFKFSKMLSKVSFGFSVLFVSFYCSTVSADELKGILQHLQKSHTNIAFSDIEKTPITGLFQVNVNGRLTFVSASGEYFISGEMYQVVAGKFINLHAQEKRAALIAQVPLSDTLIYQAEGEMKAVINIFTDVDCNYCVKLHHEIPVLQQHGVEVRYLAYPRAGLNSPSYFKILSAWCAADPKAILPLLQQGKYEQLNECASTAVDSQYKLGNLIGVSGTPTIVFADGQIFSGYYSASELIKLLAI